MSAPRTEAEVNAAIWEWKADPRDLRTPAEFILDLLAAARAERPPEPVEGVEVWAAVALSREGHWIARGGSSSRGGSALTEDYVMSRISDADFHPAAIIRARVALPALVEVAGRVEPTA
jgi:hypothetical protein